MKYLISDLNFLLTCSVILDLIIGDPTCIKHLVIYYGDILKILERVLNRGKLRIIKGIIAVFLFVSIVIAFSYVLTSVGKLPYIGPIVVIYYMSSCLAIKSLSEHAMAVYTPLKNGDLNDARLKTSYIVGRDTQELNESELTRAVVETVAENTVDGVTAPLFYLLCFGLVGGLVYKAINTLDSMWGHRNDRFEYFGKFSARLDDIANFIPARLTSLLIMLVTILPKKYSFKNTLKVFVRDRYKHPSPNSGLTESCFAGALQVQLGGTNYYKGKISQRGILGNSIKELNNQVIRESIVLMQVTSILFFILGLLIRVVI